MNTSNKTPREGRRRLPSPAMIVAVLALRRLGGSALAVNAAKNSVTTKSIRNSAVKTKKLADRAVRRRRWPPRPSHRGHEREARPTAR